MGLRERIAFWAQMRANFEHTGAVQPSSRFLARVMAAPLCRRGQQEDPGPARILEIGPGTGAVTRAVAACMGPADELVCYEINIAFARTLRQAFRDDPRLAPVANRTTVHHAAAQDMPSGERFDFAICSAPLNNFDAETIDAILTAMMGALHPGGTATLFEYLLFPSLRRTFTHGDAGGRLRRAEKAKARWLNRRSRGSSVVIRNVPPARVHELARD